MPVNHYFVSAGGGGREKILPNRSGQTVLDQRCCSKYQRPTTPVQTTSHVGENTVDRPRRSRETPLPPAQRRSRRRRRQKPTTERLPAGGWDRQRRTTLVRRSRRYQQREIVPVIQARNSELPTPWGPLPVGGVPLSLKKAGERAPGAAAPGPRGEGPLVAHSLCFGIEGEETIEVWDRPFSSTDLGTQ